MLELYKKLKRYGQVKTNTALSKLCTFKIGGPAEFVVTVTEEAQLVGLLNFLSGEGIAWLILGGGANVLFPDEEFRGVVIRIQNTKYQIPNTNIEIDAGVELSELVRLSIQNKLTGLEWAAGIPGTVGGAVRGNAGARYAFTGGEIKDAAESITVWRDGEVLELSPAECEFGYRDSIFKHNQDVILSARFSLKSGNPAVSLDMTQKIIAERRGKQPPDASAGSFFKNIPLAKYPGETNILPERFLKYKKIAAGWLIDQAGLRGYRVGGAAISESHGNFIINKNNASQADVLALVEKVKAEVYNKFGVELEEEVQIVK